MTPETPSAASAASTALAVLAQPRLPYHPVFEERFGVDKAAWKALVEAVFPAAKTSDAVLMALSYCKARNLDPFKRPVHIVPVWDSNQKRLVETVWPGIAELRTTAMRTGLYAGKDGTVFGPDVTRKFCEVEVTFPEWAQITVYRMVSGAGRCAFQGPTVHWLEFYATVKHDSDVPNAMWRRKSRSQLEKCAEAGALRIAFPEELGNEYAAEEVEGQAFRDMAPSAAPRSTGMRARLEGRPHVGGFSAAHVARELDAAAPHVDAEFDVLDEGDKTPDNGAAPDTRAHDPGTPGEGPGGPPTGDGAPALSDRVSAYEASLAKCKTLADVDKAEWLAKRLFDDLDRQDPETLEGLRLGTEARREELALRLDDEGAM